jgi:hypothetical protein
MYLLVVKFSSLFVLADVGDTCTLSKTGLLFLPPWWHYLPGKIDDLGQCSPSVVIPNGLLPIGLALLDILLRLAGFVAVVSIMIAGVEYITSSGDPQKASAARSRIYNSLIGLIIAMIATAIVTFIGGQLAS